MRVVKEFAKWMLRRRDSRLDAALCGAPLAQMQLVDGVVLDRREVHDGVALVTAVAQH
jgi:hypothetical protein